VKKRSGKCFLSKIRRGDLTNWKGGVESPKGIGGDTFFLYGVAETQEEGKKPEREIQASMNK